MARKRKIDWDKTFDEMDKSDNKKSTFKEEFENLYKPRIREDGTASVIIRFLEPPIGEDLPYVKRYSHFWKDTGGYVIANCPTSVGDDCPICKENSRIWDDNEDLARLRGRRTDFYSNIQVVKDPENPENEGKVFLFQYGLKIHDKIMQKVKPQDPLDTKVNVFDYERGANFKLKIKQVEIKIGGKKIKVPNYDQSEFSEVTHIINTKTGEPMTDDEMDTLDEQLTALKPIIGPEKFKPYQEIAQLFIKQTGIVIPTSKDGTVAPQQEETTSYRRARKEESEAMAPSPTPAPKPVPEPAPAPKTQPSFEDDDEDDDEDDFLNSLRN